MTRWAVLTGEYPPHPGGVSDYTRLVAAGLAAAGDDMTVYAPPADGPDPTDPGVTVRRLPGHFGPRSLVALDQHLATPPRPDRILIQYVPHAFGFKAMNLPFAAWVAARAKRLAPVWVMFHEVAFPFVRRPVRHNVVALGTRATARLIAGAASRVFVSIPAWEPMLRRICPRVKPAEWLPIPSNVGTTADPAAIAAARRRLAPDGGPLVGHFGTFGPLITDLLAPTAARFLERTPAARLVLIGRNSDEFRGRFAAAHPHLAPRIAATGELPPDHLPATIRACDLMIQPYPDGVSARRTSVMAALANGVPVVTNLGFLSEPAWGSAGGITAVSDPADLSAAAEAVLVRTPEERAEMAARAAEFYHTHFQLETILARLQAPPAR